MQPPLTLRSDAVCVGLDAVEAQALDDQARPAEVLFHRRYQAVLGKEHNLRPAVDQMRHDIRLQEIDDCQAVVGDDEDCRGSLPGAREHASRQSTKYQRKTRS